ncbi:unnamed protein product, partial [Ascophyllum nodosum]
MEKHCKSVKRQMKHSLANQEQQRTVLIAERQRVGQMEQQVRQLSVQLEQQRTALETETKKVAKFKELETAVMEERKRDDIEFLNASAALVSEKQATLSLLEKRCESMEQQNQQLSARVEKQHAALGVEDQKTGQLKRQHI